ncbi:MAG: hypothetical protein Q9209_007806 [Squamulea sp. 1 TL-2023]
MSTPSDQLTSNKSSDLGSTTSQEACNTTTTASPEDRNIDGNVSELTGVGSWFSTSGPGRATSHVNAALSVGDTSPHRSFHIEEHTMQDYLQAELNELATMHREKALMRKGFE